MEIFTSADTKVPGTPLVPSKGAVSPWFASTFEASLSFWASAHSCYGMVYQSEILSEAHMAGHWVKTGVSLSPLQQEKS